MTQRNSKPLFHRLSFVTLVILFQIFTDSVIFLDVGIARQIAGFIYLTFIPGMIVVKIFKWDKEGSSTTILLSVGVSIALLMLVGFAINELIPIAGISTPLSTIPLLITMNLIVLLFCYLGHLKSAEFSLRNQKIPYSILLFVFLPLLGVLGAFFANVSGDLTILYLMVIIISILTVIIVISRRFVPSNYFPYVLLALAVTLILHTSLITNYIVGWDVHSEYYAFKMTDNAARWNVSFQSWDDRIAKGNAMLSTTVLPTIYSKILNIGGTWVFKIIYPLIAAFLPFAVFKIYSTQQKKKAAFLSVFFLMSNLWFYSADAFATKQIVAQLFFALLFLVILKERDRTFKREFLFMIFGFGLVVSHYSMSYIFLFLISLVWLLQNVIRRPQGSKIVTLSEVLFFFTMAFAWYIYASAAAPFDAILNTTNHVFSTLIVDFFNPATRGSTVLMAFGAEQAESFGHQIGRIFFYITTIFIVIGFMKLVLRRKNTTFSPEFTVLSSFSMVMLGLAVVLPNLAGSFRMERFYQISLIFLAAVCILGGETVMGFLLKRKNNKITLVLLLLVLIPNFLFQIGFVYSITDDVTYSLAFSMSGATITPNVERIIISKREVSGVEWLTRNTHSPIVYADYFSGFHVLTSYGLLSDLEFINPRKFVNSSLAETTDDGWYTYLRRENVEKGIMVAEEPGVLGVVLTELHLTNISSWLEAQNLSIQQQQELESVLTNISSWLEAQNLVYSNGGCEILRSLSTLGNSTQTESAEG